MDGRCANPLMWRDDMKYDDGFFQQSLLVISYNVCYSCSTVWNTVQERLSFSCSPLPIFLLQDRLTLISSSAHFSHKWRQGDAGICDL